MPRPIDVFIHSDDVTPTSVEGFRSFVAPLAPDNQQFLLNTNLPQRPNESPDARPVVVDAWCDIIGGAENAPALHQLDARPAGSQIVLIVGAARPGLAIFARVHFSLV